MSHQNDSDNSISGNSHVPKLSINGKENNPPVGTSCLEISENEISSRTSPSFMENDQQQEADDLDEFPLPPPSSPTFPTLYNDYYGQSAFSRRFSCLPSNHVSFTNTGQRNRAPSLPALGSSQAERLNPEENFKKFLFDQSRRSSFESAYHSHTSGRSSKTPINISQLEDLEYSEDYDDNMRIESMVLDENFERTMIERRNSLSYEAIRTYFLELNPYMNPIENSLPCLDHDNNSGALNCPNCNQRRPSIDQINIHFRTNAHRRVVERQFEELFNIPDPRRSRSTSIDLFGGLGIPIIHQDRNEPQDETSEEKDSNLENSNES